MKLPITLLDLLYCPVTGEKLFYDKEKNLLISKVARFSYHIIDGIPILLALEAQKIR